MTGMLISINTDRVLRRTYRRPAGRPMHAPVRNRRSSTSTSLNYSDYPRQRVTGDGRRRNLRIRYTPSLHRFNKPSGREARIPQQNYHF